MSSVFRWTTWLVTAPSLVLSLQCAAAPPAPAFGVLGLHVPCVQRWNSTHISGRLDFQRLKLTSTRITWVLNLQGADVWHNGHGHPVRAPRLMRQPQHHLKSNH
jgi:hypothetical protein